MINKTATVSASVALLAAVASAQSYLFTIDPARTYTDGSAVIRLYTTGQMIGNYDALTNPGGTRTKPGLIGTFGDTENLPVDVNPFLQLGGAKKLNSSGQFNLALDPANSRVQLSGYNVNRLSNGPLKLGTTIALNNEAFRARNPFLLVPDHLPPVKLGLFTIDSLTVHQKAASNTGALINSGGGKYRVIVTFMADVDMNVSQLGQTVPVRITVPYSLVGFLQTNGTAATFGYPVGQGGENLGVNVNYPLDVFELGVPIGSGSTAGLRFAITLKRASFSINGTREFFAATSPIP